MHNIYIIKIQKETSGNESKDEVNFEIPRDLRY